jgi:tetratricopeptide (TPR) repeat protein
MLRIRSLVTFLLCGWLATSVPSLLAQQQLGRIIGQVRLSKGDFPQNPIMVDLQFRGSAISSVYTDDQGRFGFYNLAGNIYHVMINDSDFYPVDEMANVNPLVSPTTMLQIRLEPKKTVKQDPLANRVGGSNPYIVDPADYNRQFPKKALKEFEQAVEADRKGSREDAIRHYEKALQIAPDFYQAHNNLGSDYLSKSDFFGARKQFEHAIRLNQSDAAAYFNLSNICILSSELPAARHYLDEGMRRQPDSALGHFLEGTLNIKLGKLPQAEGPLRQAIQLDPLMAQPRLQLVNLLLQQGRKDDAVAQLRDFVGAFPESPFSAQAKELLKRLQAPSAPSQKVPR